MKNNYIFGFLIVLAALVTPTYASNTPYMDTLILSKDSYNALLSQSEFLKTHFPNEAVTVFLNQEYFTIFFSEGKMKDIMPGRYDEATLVVTTDEPTVDAIGQGDLTVADAVTLKKVTYAATDYAGMKTKVAVKVTKVTSSVIYFFDSLFV